MWKGSLLCTMIHRKMSGRPFQGQVTAGCCSRTTQGGAACQSREDQVSITVVIPTHNRVQLLDQTLSSLCAQTEREFRIVVVDHASDEDIKGLCARYQDDLALTYHWLPKEKDAPGLPRHAGMQLVETQQAVFLDCGIVVPTFFLAGHQAF